MPHRLRCKVFTRKFKEYHTMLSTHWSMQPLPYCYAHNCMWLKQRVSLRYNMTVYLRRKWGLIDKGLHVGLWVSACFRDLVASITLLLDTAPQCYDLTTGMYQCTCNSSQELLCQMKNSVNSVIPYYIYMYLYKVGLSERFKSPVTLILTSATNLFLSGCIVLTAGKFISKMEGPSSMHYYNRCYWLQPCIADLTCTYHNTLTTLDLQLQCRLSYNKNSVIFKSFGKRASPCDVM